MSPVLSVAPQYRGMSNIAPVGGVCKERRHGCSDQLTITCEGMTPAVPQGILTEAT